MATETEGRFEGASTAASEDVIAGLNDLLQLDYDAIAAYEIAIERLQNTEHALSIREFRKDHERHVRELNRVIEALGGTPKNEPHAAAPLTQSIQGVAAAGGDAAILVVWRANEMRSKTKYEKYAEEADGWPAEAKAVVEANAADERRHYEWVVGVMGGSAASDDGEAEDRGSRYGMPRPGPEPRYEGADRASVAAEKVRLAFADGLDRAARRLQTTVGPIAGTEGRLGHAATRAQRLGKRLESTAASLRRPPADRPDSLVATAIQSRPIGSMAVTFAIGFVLGRFVR